MKNLELLNNILSNNEDSCFIIAEIGQAHDGSLGTAHAYIDAVARAGANAVKFQTHIAEAESSHLETFRVKGFPQDATRYDYWKRMEFTFAQWQDLVDHATAKGLVFLSTPFSIEAVDLLEKLNIQAWKISSGEIENIPLLEKMAQTNKPLLFSSGMSSWKNIDDAVAIAKKYHLDYSIFQCTTSYPCPADKIGLNVIQEIQSRYACPSGLSDHSGTIYSGLAAVTLGARFLELHLTFSKECFGPDVSSSITLEQLQQLVDGVGFLLKARHQIVDKDQIASEMQELKTLFGKSMFAKRDLKKGSKLQESDIALKKPGTGIPAKHFSKVLGKVLLKDYTAGEQLKEIDIEH
ncbi:MAG: N-acetylneuraminate synthase family protein [Pseudomonadota bacterium]